MVDLKQIKNIYLYGDGVSFRGGIDGLSNLILTHFSENEVENSLFIFFSKTKKQMKAIEFNKDGIWLYQKKLFDARFLFPEITSDNKIVIDKKQLYTILNSLKPIEKKQKNRTLKWFYKLGGV